MSRLILYYGNDFQIREALEAGQYTTISSGLQIEPPPLQMPLFLGEAIYQAILEINF